MVDTAPSVPLVMTTIEAYKAARAALIDADRSLRRDRQERTEAEVRAERIVRAIRTEEASTIWNQEHALIPHPFPGMEFLTGRLCRFLIPLFFY